MCGIAGTTAEMSNANVSLVLEELSSRGPDGNGMSSIDNDVCFLHTRLAIQDLSIDANQPMVSPCGSYMLVYNGEIYNGKELSNKYIDNVKLTTTSDTEILLNLLIIKGHEVLNELRGIFSFGFYDKNNKKILLVRDAFGVKPLFYTIDKNDIYFASTINALLNFYGHTHRLNPVVVARHLEFIWSPGNECMLDGIFSLPPGSMLTYSSSKGQKTAEIQQWYHLPSMRSNRRKITRDINYYTQGLTEHLKIAVQRQLLSDVPVGSFLSGGVDSSSIVAIAAQLGHQLPCYTIRTPSKGGDGFESDLQYASALAKDLSLPLKIIDVDADVFSENLERSICAMGHPIADPAIVNTSLIAKEARKDGNFVLMSGTGGDDILTGYRRHTAIKASNFLPFRNTALYSSLYKKTIHLRDSIPSFRRLKKLLRTLNFQNDTALIELFRWLTHEECISVFSERYRDLLPNSRIVAPFLQTLKECEEISDLQKCLVFDQKFFLTDHNLIYTDRMSMHHGVEVRVPFLDEDFVKFASEIPESYQVVRGKGKWVFRKAMEHLLPKNILYRSKTGFGLPIREWMKSDLHHLKEKYLYGEELLKFGIFDQNRVRELDKKNNDGIIDATYTLLSIICIQIWISHKQEFIA